MGKLDDYNQKRNFLKTAEPQGKTAASEESLRFVVQHHMARQNHYDLRLEWEGVLLSWAVPKGPSFNTRDKRLAVKVEDHPLEYRNFEGTIPKGEYGGGVVMLWDEGYWEPYGDVNEGLIKGELKFALNGRRLKGKWALVRWKAKSDQQRDNWLLLKEKDELVQTEDGISDFETSIRTGRTMKEIEEGRDEKLAKNPFASLDVQLAKLVNKIPKGDDWVYELKYDGYRIVAFIEGNSVRLITRNGYDYTNRFSAIASSLLNFASGRAMVLDGEIVVLDEAGKTDFQALQNVLKKVETQNPTYIIFDLLALDGADLRQNQLKKRKEILEKLMQNVPATLYYSRSVVGNGQACFTAACEAGMEGVIGKKVDAIYSGTRNGSWIKLKCDNRQEFVIAGYTQTAKKTEGISSLLLGAYEGEDLIYVGRAGTGLSDSERIMLEQRFENLIIKDPAFKFPPSKRSQEKIYWLKPDLVAEIKFAEWTKDNLLRQASFKGLRTDKDPKEVTRDKAEDQTSPASIIEAQEEAESGEKNIIIQGIKITSPDKVLFENPVVTKADVVRYYEQVSERMLPFVSHRILSVVRCPKGIAQPCFFKKHPAIESKEVVIPISIGDEETEDYFYLDNIAGIIYQAQMGTLEFHTWGSQIRELEKPDMMVFDLDPDEGMNLERVRQGVLDIRSILSELSLTAYLKTSGGKGYHVVVPLQPVAAWEVFHAFARKIAEVMEQKWPERYTSNVRKAKRKDKIFIDWIRNARGATSVAPYSLRARKGAKVSMPITWDELSIIAPDGISMEDALKRIKDDDPWEGFYSNNQRLK